MVLNFFKLNNMPITM